MSHIDRSLLAPIRARLLNNKTTRTKWGALNQDFVSSGRLPGEIFLGNCTEAQFEALPLKTKRKGPPARTSRYFCEPAPRAKDMVRVFTSTYEELYKDKESFAVYVYTYELDMLGLDY